jgi:glycosyltransferase involved in cell wall biosynthesis
MISIVVPVYNKQASIRETLNSILEQKGTDFEIVLVNDGSTDSSIDIIKSYPSDDRLTIINIENRGVSFARNVGILNSIGEYIAFIDADDIWHESYLYEMLNLINKYPKAGLYYAQSSICKEELGEYLFKGINTGPVENYYLIVDSLPILTSCTIVSRRCFNEVGMFNPQYSHGEDLDMWKRIVQSYEIVVNNRILTFYNSSKTIERASNKTPDIRNKFAYHIRLNKVSNRFERDFWFRHMYGTLSIYLRDGKFQYVLLFLIKHFRFAPKLVFYKFVQKRKIQLNQK